MDIMNNLDIDLQNLRTLLSKRFKEIQKEYNGFFKSYQEFLKQIVK